ncbi:hypothetical protein BDV06DRAFT_225210 [Aspergillus oleicola]
MADPPTFDELPQRPGLPKGCAWGLWDQDGRRDELGTLNLLTPEVVVNAMKEVTEGIRVSLNLPLDVPSVPVFNRQPFQHRIIDNSTFSSSQSFDDTFVINTQSSSQWDGLRHVIHRESQRLYNGTQKDEVSSESRTNTLGIERWHLCGGILSRGVLIDYVAYAQRHNIAYSPIQRHEIRLTDLKIAAKEQGVKFRSGDVLLVRTGLIEWYNENPDRRDAYFGDPNKTCIGIEATTEVLSWLWNQHFAAVAGDALAWEAVPYPPDRPSLHQHIIPMFGMPIGELWDLEELAATCARLKRYSFLLTSVPLRIPRGVASPPNAMAVF